MKRDELQNQFKNQDLNTVDPAAFLEVGGRVYPDLRSYDGLAAFQEIVNAFRAVHQPSFGSAIALSGKTVTLDGAGFVLEPSSQQVCAIQAVQCANGGGAPITINLTIGEVIVSTQVIGPAETLGIALTSKSIDKNTPLAVAVVSGTASDLITKCAYLLTSQ